jgi:cytochrome c biogenesis protein CcdA
METTTLGILAMGAGLGLVHAFDADHVAAVSGLAGRRDRAASGPAYALRWALGHGAAMLVVGVATLWIGVQLPEDVFAWAEKGIGLILVAVGASILWSASKRGLRLRRHRHAETWHLHLTSSAQPADAHDHAPLLVGLVHGVAGSGPALAMIPIARAEPLAGLAWLVVFSLGVAMGMLAVGALLGRFEGVLVRGGAGLHESFRVGLGAVTAAIGLVWLL